MSTTQQNVGGDPQIVLDWSNDWGRTWSNERAQSMGEIGEYRKRVKFWRLGQDRYRVYRITISDPVKRVILSADLEADPGQS